MHDQLWHNLEQTINQLTDAEKRDLILRLEHSIQSNGKHAHPTANQAANQTEAEMVAKQKRAVLDLLEEMEKLPSSPEPDDGLVASRDHDKILYDGSSQTGFPEKPFK